MGGSAYRMGLRVDYHVQLAGGPSWIQVAPSNEVRFDVQATSDILTDEKLAKLSDDQAALEKRHMLQALLQDRFGLNAHMETRQAAAFKLTIAKSGFKLEKGEPMGPKPEHAAPGTWYAPIGSNGGPQGIAIVAHGASIADLTERLQFYLHKSVIDQTGINGTYNFTLQFHGTLFDEATNEEAMWPPSRLRSRISLGCN
jgi:uncharacterized protein (TIGR03435 family)